MDSRPDDLDARPASSAELSLDISRVVSQVLSGEAVDIASAGQELAGKYQHLGMSGAMIEEAISRTAGMMGMIRAEKAGGPPNFDTQEPLAPSDPSNGGPQASVSGMADDAAVQHPIANGAAADMSEMEFGSLIFGPAGEAVSYANGGVPGGNAYAEDSAASSESARGGSLAKGAVAALRRAFFRG